MAAAWIPVSSPGILPRFHSRGPAADARIRSPEHLLYYRSGSSLCGRSSSDDDGAEEWSDFADMGFVSGSTGKDKGSSSSDDDEKYVPGDEDRVSDSTADDSVVPATTDFAQLLQERSGAVDWTAIQTRQFSLGQDLILSNYVGNMGFQEVTDWEYYYQNEEDEEDRQVVQPNPLDSSKYVLPCPCF